MAELKLDPMQDLHLSPSAMNTSTTSQMPSTQPFTNSPVGSTATNSNPFVANTPVASAPISNTSFGSAPAPTFGQVPTTPVEMPTIQKQMPVESPILATESTGKSGVDKMLMVSIGLFVISLVVAGYFLYQYYK